MTNPTYAGYCVHNNLISPDQGDVNNLAGSRRESLAITLKGVIMTVTITATSVTTELMGAVFVETDLTDQDRAGWMCETFVDGVLIGAIVRETYEEVSRDAGYAYGVWTRQQKSVR